MEHIFLTEQGKNKKPWNVKIKCDNEDKLVNSLLDIFVDSFIKNNFQNISIESKETQR